MIRLAQEHPRSPGTVDVDWLKVVRGCYEEAESQGGTRFAGSRVYKRRGTGWFPGLSSLVERGILRKVDKTSRLTFYVMPDREGVARALGELGYLQ